MNFTKGIFYLIIFVLVLTGSKNLFGLFFTTDNTSFINESFAYQLGFKFAFILKSTICFTIEL